MWPNSDLWMQMITLHGWFRRQADAAMTSFDVTIDKYAKTANVNLGNPTDTLNEKDLIVMLDACRKAKRMRNAMRKVDLE
jgi:hypothetical protein